MPSTELMILNLKHDQLKIWRKNVIAAFDYFKQTGTDDEGIFLTTMGFVEQLEKAIHQKVFV